MGSIRGIALITGLAFVAALAGFSTASFALDRYERQVVQQLRAAADELYDDGWRKSHDYFTDKIRRGHTESYRVTLDAKEDYLIVAFCDTDCDDVDLRLYDNRGKALDEDVERDDFPVVKVSTGAGARYEVEVWAPGCHARRCTIGIGVFYKR
ncbi:MAG: hypothetical protein K8F25_10855 [Fimbriimonadaceae bacterium]|nr:hypothetical protein [Alphaproteobacteria bacterium]